MNGFNGLCALAMTEGFFVLPVRVAQRSGLRSLRIRKPEAFATMLGKRAPPEENRIDTIPRQQQSRARVKIVRCLPPEPHLTLFPEG